MKVLSVNVGLPRLVQYQGEPVATGIFKEPVEGRVKSQRVLKEQLPHNFCKN